MADYYIQYISEGLEVLSSKFISSSFTDKANEGYFDDLINEEWNWNSFYTYMAWEGLHHTEQFGSEIMDKGFNTKFNDYNYAFETYNSVDLDCHE